jgi:hypothetical protein
MAWPLRGAGVVLAARAMTNKPLRRLTSIRAGRAVDVHDGIAVAASPDEIWSLISDYSVFVI